MGKIERSAIVWLAGCITIPAGLRWYKADVHTTTTQEVCPHLVLQKTAAAVGIVNASAALAITALSANVVVAIHIASGSGSTHTSSASSNIVDALQVHQQTI